MSRAEAHPNASADPSTTDGGAIPPAHDHGFEVDFLPQRSQRSAEVVLVVGRRWSTVIGAKRRADVKLVVDRKIAAGESDYPSVAFVFSVVVCPPKQLRSASPPNAAGGRRHGSAGQSRPPGELSQWHPGVRVFPGRALTVPAHRLLAALPVAPVAALEVLRAATPLRRVGPGSAEP